MNMMKKIVKKFPAIAMAFAIAIMAMLACSRPAYAAHKVSKHPVVFVSTNEILNGYKFKKNILYIEVCKGIVKNKKGDGYVKGHKDLYISYRYKNHPKKGTTVTSYFPLDRNPDHEALSRYDFIKTKKGKWKLIHTS